MSHTNSNGLEPLSDHLIAQLRNLGDKDLEALHGACTGNRTPNPSIYQDLEWCGRKVVRKLLNFGDGQAFLAARVKLVQGEREDAGAYPDLGERGRELVKYLERRGKIRPSATQE